MSLRAEQQHRRLWSRAKYSLSTERSGAAACQCLREPHARSSVTFDDWDGCGEVGGCKGKRQRDTRAVTDVTLADAEGYVAWLSRLTGKTYRLLTEAEWEYAARAGTTTVYYWGDEIGNGNANCRGCDSDRENMNLATPVGSFKPNAFGLYDMAGNVWQWVEDCYHNNYDGAPQDGSAWLAGDCKYRVVRGGSRINGPSSFARRTATRAFQTTRTPSWASELAGRLPSEVLALASGVEEQRRRQWPW